MGFVQSLFGSNTGSGYTASGLNSDTLTGAQTGVNNTQQQQNALLQALGAQNGIQNQSNAYEGLKNVASQYQGVANGTGPNPAQAMLNQQTGNNIQQQAALMAGQRGASANVGLMARQAGQQGGALQQQAVGQGATMQANQQLAGLQGLGQAQANVANLATQQVGQQQAAQQAAAQTALGSQANVYGLQSNINTTNAGIAAGNQKAQAGLIGGVLGSVGAGSSSIGSNSNAAGGAHGGYVETYADGGQILTPNAASNNPIQGPQSSFGQFLQSNRFNQGAQGQGSLNQDPGKSMEGGGQGIYQLGKSAYKGAKSLYDSLTAPKATEWAGADSAGQAGTLASADTGATVGGGASADAAGGAAAGEAAGGDEALALLASEGGKIQAGYTGSQSDPTTVGGTLGSIMQYLESKGGEIGKPSGMVNVVLSPGEKVIPPNKVAKAAGGKVEAKTVPGKAKLPGDNVKNDTYQTKLPAGSIVVPRTKSDKAENAASFVRMTLAKRGKK